MLAQSVYIEKKRFFYCFLIYLFIGALTQQWLVTALFMLVLIIIWMNYQLWRLNQWLDSPKEHEMPDMTGLWDNLIYHINKVNKFSHNRKRRMTKLLTRFQGIVKGLPYATIVLTDKHEIDWANAQANTLLGIDISKDRGQRIENLIREPEFHKLLRKKNQKDFIMVSPVNDTKKIMVQLVSAQENLKLLIIQDISEQWAVKEIHKAFIANASHELRTPLTVISGYLEMMQSTPNISNTLRSYIDKTLKQSERMKSIIEDLLTLSRLENSKNDKEMNKVLDMPFIIKSIYEEKKSLFPKHCIRLNITQNLYLKAAETEIISICTNLIHNAARHTPEGTQIDVVWDINEKKEACFSVADNGQGIQSRHLKYLTKRFYRVDKGRSSKEGGTGLGLAIVQHAIIRHQGSLSISSTPGKGSVFCVCFPRNRVAYTMSEKKKKNNITQIQL